MPQQNTQPMQNNQNPDETAAVLGFATNLSQQLMPKAPPQPQSAPASPPQQQNQQSPTPPQNVDLEANNKEMEEMIDSKLDEFKKEIKTTIKDQISEIKDSIQEALKEDGE